jgi:uncharacterized protein (TIGR02145 family)
MKSTGTQYWNSPNTSATNESGFSGLPGGSRGYDDGPFDNLRAGGSWWSASESGAEFAWTRFLSFSNAGVYRFLSNKMDGLCLRCIRD